MTETATRGDYVPERAAAHPVADVVQDFSPQKTTTWSDVASQCWSGDLNKCTSAFSDAFKQTFGFGSADAGKTLENRGILPSTRINENGVDASGFVVDWGDSGKQRTNDGRRPFVVQRGERETDAAQLENCTKPRLELVKQPGLPVPASGKMALEPVTDPKILSDVSKRPDGKPIEPTYIGVDNAASYKGADGRKHIAAGTPAWMDKPAAQAFVMMNEKLAAKGKRVILASEGDSTDGAINSAGRTHTQQAIATGIHAAPGKSEHEKGRGLDVRNYQDADVKAALKEFGFLQGNLSNPGVPIRGDAWHFSFNPKAEPDIARRFSQRQAQQSQTPDAPQLPAQKPVQLPEIGPVPNRPAERNRSGDKTDYPPAKPNIEGEAGNIYELKLDHNTGRHKVDASVIVPKGYDPNKPTRMLIYNHGFRTDAHAALNYSELPDQMKSADPQTVLVVPEWQANPGSESSSRGRSDQPGFYKDMLNEIMQKTPELRGKSVDDIASMGIIAHSAGYSPAMAQLYNNGLADKITSVTVLDSMYNPKAYDRWISDNLRDIAAGNKHFQLIYTGHLANQSLALESRVEQQLVRAGLGTASLNRQHGRGGDLVSPETMAQYGFVFKRSEFTTKGDGAHGAMTHVYLRQLLNSEKRRGP